MTFDRGDTWHDLPMPPDTVQSLELDGKTLYVGTEHQGVYRLDMSSRLSVAIDGESTMPTTITRLGADRLTTTLRSSGIYTVSFTTIDGRYVARLELGRRGPGPISIEIPELVAGYYLAVLEREGASVASIGVIVE